MSTKKRLTVRKLVDSTAEELSKLTESEIKSMLSQARSLFKLRLVLFKKSKNTPYSPAIEYMESYYEEGYPKIRKISRNRALSELFQIQSFFKARTSTVRGAREYIKKQDIRIFGADKKGKPLGTLTRDQRARFWSVYNEFIRQNPVADLIYGSDRIVSALNYLRKDGYDEDDIQTIIDNLKEELERQKAEGKDGNDYRNFFGYAYRTGWKG